MDTTPTVRKRVPVIAAAAGVALLSLGLVSYLVGPDAVASARQSWADSRPLAVLDTAEGDPVAVKAQAALGDSWTFTATSRALSSDADQDAVVFETSSGKATLVDGSCNAALESTPKDQEPMTYVMEDFSTTLTSAEPDVEPSPWLHRGVLSFTDLVLPGTICTTVTQAGWVAAGFAPGEAPGLEPTPAGLTRYVSGIDAAGLAALFNNVTIAKYATESKEATSADAILPSNPGLVGATLVLDVDASGAPGKLSVVFSKDGTPSVVNEIIFS